MKLREIVFVVSFLLGVFSFGYAGAQAQQPQQAKQGGQGQQKPKEINDTELVRNRNIIDALLHTSVGKKYKAGFLQLKDDIQTWKSEDIVNQPENKKKVDIVNNTIKNLSKKDKIKYKDALKKQAIKDALKEQEKKKNDEVQVKKADSILKKLYLQHQNPNATFESKENIMKQGTAKCEELASKGLQSFYCKK